MDDKSTACSKLTLYGYPKTRATRVVWLLEVLQLEYEYRLVNLMKGDGRTKAFLDINPAGKIPALVIEDRFTIVESGAILNYLAESYAMNQLIPEPASANRAVYDQWSFFTVTELEQPLWTMGKHQFALPKSQRVPEVIKTAAWEFQKSLALLSEGLGDHLFLMGQCGGDWNRFTAVDILVGHTLIWGEAFGQPIEQPNLKQYLARLKETHGYRATANRESQLLKT